MNYFPQACMCGALDCPACHPELSGMTPCAVCDEDCKTWALTDGVCPECAEHLDNGEVRCEDCHEWGKPEELDNNGVCEYCRGEK